MLRSLVGWTFVLGSIPVAAAQQPRPQAVLAALSSYEPRTPHYAPHDALVRRTPGIRIWTSGDDLVRRGERVRVFYRTERDAYVTIFRVDTDGRVRIIFPRDPGDENYGYGGATYTVSSAGQGTAFYIDDYAGVGYIFGIASAAPFNYDPVWADGRWDLHGIGDGRIHGDPLTSLEELSLRMLPESFGDFDTHLLPYYVEQRYSYPRFVCYDCHSYVPWTYWDPYQAWCRRYTLVVWRDPYYYYPSYWYPTRYYGGTRVVYTSPGGSRYVFKNRENAAPGIDYRDRRTTPVTTATTQVGGRRVSDDRGVRGTDLGGIGSIPAPRAGGRRTIDGNDGERDGGEFGAPGAITNGGRRTSGGVVDAGSPAAQQPDGGRRRTDTQPGIEIVPRPETPERPADGGRRGEAARPNDGARPARPEPQAPVTRRGSESSEARPPRPDNGGTRPAPIEVGKPSDEGRRLPDSRPVERQPEARPERQPEARQPEARQPERQPEARQPERRPETRQPERAPERQPQRQPESRPQPQSRPQASPPPAPRQSPPPSSRGGRRNS